MVKIFHENDADLSLLDGKTIAIIGYGLQGSAQAMCMKDTGVNVIIGARPNGPSWNKAREYGFEVYEIPEASKRAEIIYLLVPDEHHEKVYKEQIEPYMEKCEVICVSHAFSIVFGQVVPPENVDIIMVAPKAPGK
ncbi:MAG: NAD(P)-binding domain-containing protein, partial [Candidatus Lokiarchaeota archaeon]|nr:NAD(P)-binding domain-containing protein [Candidatus Lokiarchaeota archaeon]